MYRLDTNENVMTSSSDTLTSVLSVSASEVVDHIIIPSGSRRSEKVEVKVKECLMEQRLETVNLVEF